MAGLAANTLGALRRIPVRKPTMYDMVPGVYAAGRCVSIKMRRPRFRLRSAVVSRIAAHDHGWILDPLERLDRASACQAAESFELYRVDDYAAVGVIREFDVERVVEFA